MALRINENARNESIEEFPVQITITHGDLGHALFPVAVGHHKGDSIVSAERVLDRYLDGHLSEKNKMGIYPGEIETSEIFLEFGNNPPGGVVVGLGNFGELNLGSFTRTMSHAVLDLAMKLKEHSDHSGLSDDEIPSGISSLLIGSGFGGLTVRSSIKGILAGLRAANKIISELGIEGIRQIEVIEFVEIYEDRAIQAARILHQIINDEQYKIFTLPDPYIRKVPGGRRRVIEMPEEDWWHRLKVDGIAGNNSRNDQHLVPLHFTSLTDRARAVVSNLATQRALVDQLVEESVSKIEWEATLSQTMFELLIPNDFKEYAAEKRNILWILDKKSAEYPWELLYDPSLGEKEPMAIRSGMLRQLSVTEYRVQTTHAEPWAMVVGDTISDFSELHGAQKEAKVVSTSLQASGLKVVELIQKSASEILTALFKHKYQVLHLATHGVFDFGESRITGMVLDKDSFLTPAEIKQMRYIPELVFINCCHLGKVSSELEHLSINRNKLAANLGTQLIQMGVKAVIVAGWAVHDGAAEAFATTFYGKMKSGENFGTAVLEARNRVFQKYKQYNTWGAYQCYGDPYYTLVSKNSRKRNTKKRYIDPLEVIIDLENIICQVEPADSGTFSYLKSKLAEVVPAIPDVWKNSGKVLETIALAYSSLHQFEDAISFFETAILQENANYSLKMLERFAHLKVTYGSRVATEKTWTQYHPEQGKKWVESGIKDLQKLLTLSKTSHRLRLLGDAYKRGVLIAKSNQEAEDFLKKSSECYREAFQNYRDSKDLDNHALLNWLTTAALLEWKKPGNLPSEEELQEILERFRTFAHQRNENESSFQTMAAMAGVEQFYLVWKGETKDVAYRKAILDAHTKACKCSQSFILRGEILEEFQLLIQLLHMLKSPVRNQEKIGLIQELSEILQELKHIMST